jgi:aquaporin Z
MNGRPDLARRLVAEALGTFCLVFAGTGAVVVNAVAGDPLGHGGVAAAFDAHLDGSKQLHSRAV